MFENCRVCDDPNASKHYGSFCCSGCKGFFRRTIKFKRIYRCQYSKNCTISPEYRNSCRACRFDKCLTAGLDPNMVHDDRGIVNAKNFKAEMEAKTAKNNKHIKEEIPSRPQSPELKPMYSSMTTKTKTEIMPPSSHEQTQVVAKRNLAKINFEIECHKWHDAVVANSKRMFQATSGPLGDIKIIPAFNQSDGFSIANYFVLVERLCDNYFDSTAAHTTCSASEFYHSTELSASKALSDPRQIAVRTKIDWPGRFFVTPFAFKRIWCRVVSHYVDWTSHIPEVRELSIEDQIHLVIDRAVPCVDLLLGYRGMQNNVKGVPLSGGTYFPRDKQEQELIDPCLRPYLSGLADWVYDEFIIPAKDMALTETEYALLRLLIFFVPVPGLSTQGKEIVRKASNFYREVLVQHIKNESQTNDVDIILSRMSEVMKFLPVIETAKTLEDEGFSVMTLFNIADMQGELSYEIHIRKGGH